MSGHSDSTSCPVCNSDMDTYTDYKPFDTVNGECLNCGFTYYTKVERMPLKELNERIKEHNENYEGEKDMQLKPMTKKKYDSFKESDFDL